ncbi:hypothetical protein D9758_001214 [Tetrapyrgos nigripes]|uniref:Golgi apparatus membrane protein TVP38 n=1 Tax=Tetrapyrgos nigripes TaxID=182062 RepID=A0A8H5GRW4_9AGAR|nr:hypothetical protein D9758_001214 [Tetrapyrgos nigripes]
MPESYNEKDLASLHSSPSSSRPQSPSASSLTPPPSSSARLSHPGPLPLLIPERGPRRSHRSNSYKRPRGLRITNLLRSWAPVIAYAATSLGFLVAIAFYRTELFALLDDLSQWLQADLAYGLAVLFFLIFLTTFPPLPLYSTLIVLSGYTFGPWIGFAISYSAALSGALIVFLLSRALLHDSISRWLNNSCTMKRVVRAIEKRPKLLFLIRLAPYPYNVMNCLLAASPTLTLRTYTLCTALSLFKLIIHTSLGASVHSFKDYHAGSSASVAEPGTDNEGESGAPVDESETGAHTVARMWTILGVVLCIAILVYLSYVARKAIDEELDNEPDLPIRRGRDDDDDDDNEERVAFLSPQGRGDLELGLNDDHDQSEDMVESPFKPSQPLPFAAAAATSLSNTTTRS